MTRAEDLRRDYDHLGELLMIQKRGEAAAAIARERRIISEELEKLEAVKETSRADELAAKRASRRGNESPAARRKLG